MDIIEIINVLKEVPIWAWIILAIVIVFFFGDRKRWDYEVTFSFIEDVGHGEIEFESVSNKLSKRERKTIEIELELEPAAQNKAYDIYLNDKLVLNISAQDTHSSRVRIREKYQGEKPNQGDNVEVKCNNSVIFTGKLHKD